MDFSKHELCHRDCAVFYKMRTLKSRDRLNQIHIYTVHVHVYKLGKVCGMLLIALWILCGVAQRGHHHTVIQPDLGGE